MRRSNVLFTVTGLISLLANVLAILAYFSAEGPFSGWRPSAGLLLVMTFVFLAYSLIAWSTLVRRRTQPPDKASAPSLRPARFLLNGMAALPLLAVWFHLALSIVGWPAPPAKQAWLLALALAWVTTPFISLGLVAIGDVLGPLRTPHQAQDQQAH
jgi:hypothetical protein